MKQTLLIALGVVVLATSAAHAQTTDPGLLCLGQFETCLDSGACVIFKEDCSKCTRQQYMCPDRKTCVEGKAWLTCPGIQGTHLDPALSIEDRISFLVNKANATEKIAQLTNDAPAMERFYVPSYNWLNDDEHGVKQPEATSFPNGCALGATWDEAILRKVGAAIGQEARGVYNGNTHMGNRGHGVNGVGISLYAPNMNLVRNPLWGRAQEVLSEDPKLSARLTNQYVQGMQLGDGTTFENTTGVLQAAACCKHYAAYDLESIPVGRKNFSANVDVVNMWETYMPVFETCISEAKGAHVMCSYNSINGVPTCADPKLLNDVLRTRLGFDGFVVSDYDAWADLVDTHHVCGDYECAAADGINNGMDQEGGGTNAIDQLPAALAKGDVKEAAIDQAFRRIFRVRIRLGMLDPPTAVPFNYISNSSSVVSSPAHQQLNLQAARESMTLLTNKGGALPIAPVAGKTIVLVGPSAAQGTLLQGNYAVPPSTPITTIQQALTKLAHVQNADVSYAAGCTDIACASTAGFAEATNLISGMQNPQQDLAGVVVVLGLDQAIESEGHDRSSLDLPGNQIALVQALRDTVTKMQLSTRIVVVLVHGGTLALKNLPDIADAILDAHYPGQQGGPAVAETLLGMHNPGGKVPVTYYQDTSNLPPMGQMDLYAGDGITYRYFTGPKPDFPFGHGLSYTTFAITSPKAAPSMDVCDPISVTVNVTNVGSVQGVEVVQLYVLQRTSSKLPYRQPIQRLTDFSRVSLKPHESTMVTLTVDPEYRSFVVSNNNDIYEPERIVEGQINLQLWVGNTSDTSAKGNGEIVVVPVKGQSKNLLQCNKDKEQALAK